jgi:hypothetical protein
MVNPARDTTAGCAYNDLRNSARRHRRATDEVMVEYVLERFLYRLATSPAGREYSPGCLCDHTIAWDDRTLTPLPLHLATRADLTHPNYRTQDHE